MRKKRKGLDRILDIALQNPDVIVKEEKFILSKRSRRPLIDGITFDSESEGQRYLILKQWLDDGRITSLKIHPVYVLKEEEETLSGKSKKVTWEADFEYIERGVTIIEDWKGKGYMYRNFKEKLPWIISVLGNRYRIFINSQLSGSYFDQEWVNESGQGRNQLELSGKTEQGNTT